MFSFHTFQTRITGLFFRFLHIRIYHEQTDIFLYTDIGIGNRIIRDVSIAITVDVAFGDRAFGRNQKMRILADNLLKISN